MEALYLHGKVVKHKDGLLYPDPTATTGFEINVVKKSFGYQPWERYWGNPSLEGTFLYMDMGDNQILGKAIAIIPGIRFSIFKKARLDLKFHIGAGIAYLTKKYDFVQNPRNNAIGSNINNGTRVKLVAHYQLNNRINGFVAYGLNHFSNGLSVSPNSGINTFSYQFGLRWSLQKTPFDEQRIVHLEEKKNKWGLLAQYTQGFSNSDTPDGPTYPVYSTTLAATYGFSPFQNLVFGMEYEFHTGIYNFQKFIFTEEDIARNKATRYSLILADELFFGAFGFRIQLGYYLDIPEKKMGDPVYFKLTSNYHFPYFEKYKVTPYVGVVLKSHFAVAEYLGFAVGFRI